MSLLIPITPGAALRSVGWWRLAAAGVCLALAHLPLLSSHAAGLWARPHYQFFPLLVLAAAYLAWRAGPNPTPSPRFTRSRPPALRFVRRLAGHWCSAGLAVDGNACHSDDPGGAGPGPGGARLLAAMAPPLLLLVWIIPLPFELDLKLVREMQGLTVQAGSALLDLLGVPHVRMGNVLELARQRLLVEEACSGGHSFFAVLAFTLFLGMWLRRPALHNLFLLAAAAGFILIGNVARIAIAASLQVRYDVDVLTGWPHEVLGFVLVAVYLGLVLSTDQLLLFFTETVLWLSAGGEPDEFADPLLDSEAEQPAVAAEVAPQAPSANSAGPGLRPGACWVIALAYGGLALAQFLPIRAAASTAAETAAAAPRLVPTVSVEYPARLGGWEAGGGGAGTAGMLLPGVSSQHRRYRLGGLEARVSLDHPFFGWHDLAICYQAQGWQVRDRGVWRADGDDSASPCAEVRLTKGLDSEALLLFGLVDERGAWLEPVAGHAGVKERFLNRLRLSGLRSAARATYQLQVFLEHVGPLSPAEQGQARELFHAARTTCVGQLFPSQGAKP